MDAGAIMLLAGCILAAAAIGLLRLAWGRPSRSVPLDAAAWALLIGGLAFGGAPSGAWGLSIVSLVAMGTACVLLAHAAATSPDGRSRPSRRRAHMLPDRSAPRRLGRRLVTFFLVVPAALIVALAMGLAARVLADFMGLHEANSNVLTLLLMPLLWAVLTFTLLMTARRHVQALVLIVPAVLSGAILLAGTA